MTQILISVGAAGIVATAAVLVAVKLRMAKAAKSVGEEVSVLEEQITSLDQKKENALRYLESLVSLDLALASENEISGVNTQLESAKGKLAKLESELAEKQAEVDKEEQAYAEIKKGKDNAEQVADELRAANEQAQLEFERLEDELESQQEQMNVLAEELALTETQSQALAQIYMAIKDSTQQMQVLYNARQTAAERFLNLQTQYSELENEYKKLVEKELSGELAA